MSQHLSQQKKNHSSFVGVSEGKGERERQKLVAKKEKEKKKLLYYRIIFSYSFSLPLESFHLRNMTDASTLAGENVLGSFRREIILRSIVLQMAKQQMCTINTVHPG